MQYVHNMFITLIFLGLMGFSPFTFFSHPPVLVTSINNPLWVSATMKNINRQANNIDQTVLRLSLTAYQKARHLGLDDKELLTIIDYSKPSSERRLWVVNLKNDKVLFNTWVTHGKNSGNIMATSFSNEPGSLKSSIGVFTTEQTYLGGNGYSLRLIGLEQGINDNAYKRDIVVHGAWYADANMLKNRGQIGRSWGCPAVSPKTSQPLIDTIKNKTLLVAYYPDPKWLKTSTFITG
jgi:hypothetical protein